MAVSALFQWLSYICVNMKAKMFWFCVRPSSSAYLLVYLSAYVFLVLPDINDM